MTESAVATGGFHGLRPRVEECGEESSIERGLGLTEGSRGEEG